jgi:hypothetical protein
MDERTNERISRRDMLKKLGAGAAVAWTAPVVASFGARAFASPHGLKRRCGDGGNWSCGDSQLICGFRGPFDLCLCDLDTEGRLSCWQDFSCDAQDCVSTADCPTGYRCFPDTCCGTPKCAPICGLFEAEGRRPTSRIRTASGRSF